MSRDGISSWLPTLLPAILFTLPSAALWLAIGHTPAALVGWLFLTTLAATIAAIAAAGLPVRRPRAALAAVIFIQIFMYKVIVWNQTSLLPALWTAAVAASWTALWGSFALALRRRLPALGIPLPLTIASLTLAIPVAAMPFVRWAGHWDTTGTWQGRVVSVIAHACPFFPLLNSLKSNIRLDWGALPLMYTSSGLGQEIPLQLPAPWLCCILYATLAAALLLLGRRARHPAQGSPQ
jgi:hypothetical protein